MPALPPPAASLAARQDGTVARAQLLAVGATRNNLRTWLHHRLLSPVHPGTYVTHTGQPTRRQLEWAAVLYAAPAALRGSSALLAHDGRLRIRADGPIGVAIDAGRRLPSPPPGVDVRRVVDLASRIHPSARPPRMWVEDAVLDAAAEARSEAEAVALVAQVVSGRLTTPARITEVLRRRHRLHRRAFLEALVDDLAEGGCSLLERRYLRDVERAHGLPTAARQVRASSRGTIWRDVEYESYGVVVELDGRLDHTQVIDRSRDLDRDLDAAVDGRVTVRLGHGQVMDGACATAARIGLLLQQRGWCDDPRACPRCA